MTSKRGPAKQRPLPPHLQKGRMSSTFFSPKLEWPPPWPQKPDPQEPAPLQESRALPQRPALRGSSPRLSAPNMCTHIPEMLPLHWNGCKFLSCRILSKQTAMNCTPAGDLNQALLTSLQQSFQMPSMSELATGPKETTLKMQMYTGEGKK